MAADLVNAATSEKLTEMDWTKSIEICELVARDQRQARDVIKEIKKRVGSKSKNAQLFAVMLLEVLMNNVGEPIHTQVIDTGLLPVLVKLVKKKSELPVREKVFLLLDATQTSLGGTSGRFPQYYTAYYDLVSAGVQFPQRPRATPKGPPTLNSGNKSTNGKIVPSVQSESVAPRSVSKVLTESSIIQKAAAALEVLRDVLDAASSNQAEEAKDEFTLDLVEQCSFHKQQVMHLAVTCRDENTISQAIELNEQLQRVLSIHDALISARSTSSVDQLDKEETEEEEAEQLYRRMRKGKACAQPNDEDRQSERSLRLLSVPEEKLHRPLIRPVSSEEVNLSRPVVSIPPPPAKHVEREKFFKENKDVSALAGHTRGLSFHSRNGSSSYSESLDLSE